MKHCLKKIQPYFADVENGTKTFEVRKNDRNFKNGDILFLQEYDEEYRKNKLKRDNEIDLIRKSEERDLGRAEK